MAKQFKDGNGAVVGETAVIAKYFRKPGETMAEFAAQLKALDAESKTELAVGAAKELGWTAIAD